MYNHVCIYYFFWVGRSRVKKKKTLKVFSIVIDGKKKSRNIRTTLSSESQINTPK